jgi:hypothetical protein
MPYENISARLSEEEWESIFRNLQQVKAKLPFVVNLTPKELLQLRKMGKQTVDFVEKALRYARQNPHPITQL